MSAAQCVHVRAGGRREVLRRLPIALARCNTSHPSGACWPNTFVWDNDQPTLVLDIPETLKATGIDMLIVMIEEILDELMFRYPWQEQPLLDWTGQRSTPRLSVTAVERPVRAARSGAAAMPPNVLRSVQSLAAENGGILKDLWMQALSKAFSDFPALCGSPALLLEQIPEPLRREVEQKLRRAQARHIRADPDPHGLWQGIRDALPALTSLEQLDLLEQVGRTLGFRRDEHAYLMLLARTFGTSAARVDA